MSDTQELLEMSRRLGEALAAHPTVKSYYAAQQAVRDDTAARQLLEEYQRQAAHIQSLEAEQKPIDATDKQKLRDCEQNMAGNDALKGLMRWQAEYVSLMSQVNQAMEGPLTAMTRPEPSE